MKCGKFPTKLAGAWLALFVAGIATAVGQPVTLPPPQVITASGQPPRQDPFDALITSAASFDIDSPVTARAEFDPPVAAMGQRIIFRVEVSALDESLKMPDQLPTPAGIEFRPGGHGQLYQPTGSMKLQPRTTYLYHITATNAGDFTMPSFEVLAYGKPVKVPATTLTVAAQGRVAAHEPPGLLVDLPPGDIYTGQLLRMTLLLPDNGSGHVLNFNKAHIAGEFVFSETSPYGAHRENVQRDGKSFPAFIQEVVISPLRAGRLDIVAQVYAIVTRPVAGQTNVFTMAQVLVDSDPVTLHVKDLPAQGRLPGFTGAVGIFSTDAPHLSTNSIRAGDPLTLTVTLRGEGNVGHLTPPPAPELREWQTFPPTGESIPVSFIQQRGFVNFNYTMIPLSDQLKTTPPIPFSYFDPVKKTYVDLTIPSVPLTVTPGVSVTNIASFEPDESANAEREPVFTGLAKEPGFAVAGLAPVQQRSWFLLLQIVPAAALAGLWFWDSRRRFHTLHPEVMLKRRARRGLRRELRRARRAAAAGNASDFAASAANALREACAPHSAANPNALVCADVLRELPAPESKQSEIVRRLFAAADAVRFGGPDRNGQDLLALQPDLERLLAQMKERL
jgi:hypothetical protein